MRTIATFILKEASNNLCHHLHPEGFFQAPSDPHVQSLMWRQYNHHGTTKFSDCLQTICCNHLCWIDLGCRANKEILPILEDKPRVSIMADQGFTIKQMSKKLRIDLNLPPLTEGKQQLPADKVKEGRKITFIRFHVERALGRIKYCSKIT